MSYANKDIIKLKLLLLQFLKFLKFAQFKKQKFDFAIKICSLFEVIVCNIKMLD